MPAPDASLHLAQTSVAPPPGPADPGGQGEDFGKSSPLGFLILVLFFIAVAFLIRSMTKHLKRLPESFDDKPAGEDAGAVDDADGAPSPTPDTKP
ncbi:hypothetical protein BJP25_03405 [Actinokineospora bangkokensis]|uniref:Preprotein translocase subunit SecG n=1 Tax=Actinokineospora bangkokensis TaxID=1193682 RepID=A0A1Q9LE90_9PSEU|nr:hypothetical protein BJP25_03405 [Actinokineospora bangkokensis]